MRQLPRFSRSAPQRAAQALFACLFGIYLLTSSGHNYAIDEELMFEVTENLVLHGGFALNAGSAAEPPQYSQYGPGQSIAALPLYGLGRALARMFPTQTYAFLTRAVVGWFNPLITAAVAALLYQAVCMLGYRHRVGLTTALLYGLGTMAWPHSKTFFAEPLTALLLFASFVLLLRLRHAPAASAPQLWLVAISGLLAGLAPSVKVQTGVALPVLALYALLPAVGTPAWSWRRGIVKASVWSAGAGLGLGLLALYQFVLFGSVLQTGYGNSVWSDFNAPFWEGFNGQLWSSGRGIIWYAHPVLLLPAGLWLFRSRDPHVTLLCLLMALSHLLLYAKWVAWDGAGAWGPRFLNTVLPFMVLPLAAFLETLRGWRTPGRTSLLLAVVLLAVPVQVAGLTINMNAFFSATRSAETSYYRIADSAIVGHLRFATRQLRTLYNLHVAPNSVVLRDGFDYSEGRPAQVPRWTLPAATIAVRAQSFVAAVTLALDSCAVQPGPAQVTLEVGQQPLVVSHQPCPPRSYHLLVPSKSNTVRLGATAWEPSAVGIQRDGPLGVLLRHVSGDAAGRALAVQGELVPIPPMPAGQSSLRRWTSDHRLGHWDFWWWYLAHSPLSTELQVLLGGLWLTVGLGAIAWGVRQQF